MPQDARNKLRQMGGITAAFPEMVQAQQEMPMAPVQRGAPAEGFTFQDWQSMSRGDRREAGLPVSDIGGQLFFDRFQAGLGLVPPDARYTSEGLIREERLPSYTSDPSIISADRSLQEAIRAEGAATSGPVTRESQMALDRAKRDQLAALAALREARLAAGDADPVDQRPDQERVRKEQLLELYGPGSEGGPTRPEARPGIRPRARPDDIAARATELLNIPTDDTGGGDTPSAPTLRERYDEQLALLKEVFGEDDNEAARDKAMTLAMVGLAALTGPRGQLLQNLAEGALIGLSATGKRREGRRERERELKTFALQTAIDQQAAAAEADARAAEQQFSRDTQLAVARTNALGRGGGGLDFEATRTIAEVARDLPGEVAQDFSEGLLTYPSGMDDPQEQQQYRDLQVRERALNYARDLLSQASPGQAEQLMRGAQEYLYRGEDNLPIVRGPRDLTFILPGQEYLKVDPVTGKYTKEKKGE